jgi:Hint module
VGDRILSSNSAGELKYSEVIAVPHAKNSIRAQFIEIVTTSGRSMKMTGYHVIPAGQCSTPGTSITSVLPLAYARSVAVGDCVKTVNGLEMVVDVKESVSEGVYTVVTMEEFVVVNGVVASPYAISHMFANVYYNVHRLVAYYKDRISDWRIGAVAILEDRLRYALMASALKGKHRNSL